jgi:arogenate dehydrogenase (NADP+)
MFGPESGKHGWGKLPFVFDKVRVAEDGDQAAKCDQFLSIFEQEVILPGLLISLMFVHSGAFVICGNIFGSGQVTD